MRIKNFIRKNYKVGMGFILGIVVCIGIGVGAVTTKEVGYDNSTSNLTSTNMQDAIDELNTKATTKIAEAKNECPSGYSCLPNIVAAYTYNSSSCVTGEEDACQQTTCYKNKVKGSCPAGTIIKYRVNDSEIKYFHVLHDDGKELTMQQRENTVSNTVWNTSGVVTDGPQIALQELEHATSSWINVENQTYTMGTTNFNETNAYTGCQDEKDGFLICKTNLYTLGSRTARARMITVQEATILGCKPLVSGSCSHFTYGNFWTMSALNSEVWAIDSNGELWDIYSSSSAGYGARAVVVVNK